MVVDHPEAVEIMARPINDGVDLTIRVAPGEMGMVIGKQGRMIEAIRHLEIACGARLHQRVKLDVQEPDGTRVGY